MIGHGCCSWLCDGLRARGVPSLCEGCGTRVRRASGPSLVARSDPARHRRGSACPATTDRRHPPESGGRRRSACGRLRSAVQPRSQAEKRGKAETPA
ncbi:MAG: hypothetical protein LBE67_10100 [Kocuria palustris]|nr:hypothetical protein [Kocuria palustris]